jgi:hypothetical protein
VRSYVDEDFIYMQCAHFIQRISWRMAYLVEESKNENKIMYIGPIDSILFPQLPEAYAS